MTATQGSLGTRFPPLAAPIACGCCLVGAAAYVGAVDPSQGGAFPICPFRALTGLWCPGCGVTRASHHLLRGDLVRALQYNALVLVILAALAAAWLVWALHAAGRTVHLLARVPVRAQVLGGVILLAFTILRNLPGVHGLRG